MNCNANSVCFAGSSSKISTGWTLGGGIEYALWLHWTVKAEYLYVSLSGGSVTEFAVDTSGLAPASYNANFNHANFNVVRAGLNYKFY